MMICPAIYFVIVELVRRRSMYLGEYVGERCAEQRGEHRVRLLDFVTTTPFRKNVQAGENKDCGVSLETQRSGHVLVNKIVPAGNALPFGRVVDRPGLHKGGVEVEIVGMTVAPRMPTAT